MKRAETCSCSLCNKLYTYLNHYIVVLDKYIHSNLVYYKHNGDDDTYELKILLHTVKGMKVDQWEGYLWKPHLRMRSVKILPLNFDKDSTII